MSQSRNDIKARRLQSTRWIVKAKTQRASGSARNHLHTTYYKQSFAYTLKTTELMRFFAPSGMTSSVLRVRKAGKNHRLLSHHIRLPVAAFITLFAFCKCPHMSITAITTYIFVLLRTPLLVRVLLLLLFGISKKPFMSFSLKLSIYASFGPLRYRNCSVN